MRKAYSFSAASRISQRLPFQVCACALIFLSAFPVADTLRGPIVTAVLMMLFSLDGAV